MSPLKLSFCLLLLLSFSSATYGAGTGIRYQILDRSKNKPGDEHTDAIGPRKAYWLLRAANQYVLGTFGQEEAPELKYDRVFLIIESFEERRMPNYAHAVASTIRNTIRLNSDYLQRYDGDVVEEFAGILYHESTHVWQNTGNGQAPMGLLNGIADYVRLKAGFAPKGWPKRGLGLSWDVGFAVTAYFLEYCDVLMEGGSFVFELNAMMKHSYSEDYFRRLLGKSVHELWRDYVDSYRSTMREAEYKLDDSVSTATATAIVDREKADNVVVQPRISTRDIDEAIWKYLVEKVRGLIKMISTEVAVSYKFKENGYEP